MKYALNIDTHEGYGYDQVRGIKVGKLIDRLRELEEDDELFLTDPTDKYGANWHSFIMGWDMIEEIDDEDDEDEE